LEFLGIGRGSLGIEIPHVATPPSLIAIDFHLLIHVDLSRELHLACHWTGRITIGLTKDVGASRDTLWPPVLEKGANVERRHHSPLSSFWLFDAETFKKTRVYIQHVSSDG
jgi:hypothetical protein